MVEVVQLVTEVYLVHVVCLEEEICQAAEVPPVYVLHLRDKAVAHLVDAAHQMEMVYLVEAAHRA